MKINPYESQIVRAELVEQPRAAENPPWPLWAKLTIWACVIIFGPGGLGALLIGVTAVVMAVLKALGIVEFPAE